MAFIQVVKRKPEGDGNDDAYKQRNEKNSIGPLLIKRRRTRRKEFPDRRPRFQRLVHIANIDKITAIITYF